MRQIEGADDLIVVLRVLGRRVLEMKIDFSPITLYESWFIVMIWFSACSSVAPSMLTVAGRSANSRSKLTLMPCAAPIAFMMSRRLTLLKWKLIGSRDAGLRIGSADAAARARACPESAAWAATPRSARESSDPARRSWPRPCRLLGSNSLAGLNSPSAASS